MSEGLPAIGNLMEKGKALRSEPRCECKIDTTRGNCKLLICYKPQFSSFTRPQIISLQSLTSERHGIKGLLALYYNILLLLASFSGAVRPEYRNEAYRRAPRPLGAPLKGSTSWTGCVSPSVHSII